MDMRLLKLTKELVIKLQLHVKEIKSTSSKGKVMNYTLIKLVWLWYCKKKDLELFGNLTFK